MVGRQRLDLRLPVRRIRSRADRFLFRLRGTFEPSRRGRGPLRHRSHGRNVRRRHPRGAVRDRHQGPDHRGRQHHDRDPGLGHHGLVGGRPSGSYRGQRGRAAHGAGSRHRHRCPGAGRRAGRARAGYLGREQSPILHGRRNRYRCRPDRGRPGADRRRRRGRPTHDVGPRHRYRRATARRRAGRAGVRHLGRGPRPLLHRLGHGHRHALDRGRPGADRRRRRHGAAGDAGSRDRYRRAGARRRAGRAGVRHLGREQVAVLHGRWNRDRRRPDRGRPGADRRRRRGRPTHDVGPRHRHRCAGARCRAGRAGVRHLGREQAALLHGLGHRYRCRPDRGRPGADRRR